MDSVIALRHPQDYRPDQGARFEVHFEKHRGFHGADADPFEARYAVRDGTAIWTRTTIADVDLKRVADAIREGMSIRETAEELGMNRSRVERLRAKAKDQGLLSMTEAQGRWGCLAVSLRRPRDTETLSAINETPARR